MIARNYSATYLVTAVGITLVLLLFGASVALMGPFAAYVAMGFGMVMVFIVLFQFSKSTVGDLIFVIAIILPLLLAFFLKLTHISPFFLWQVALLTPAVFGIGEFWRNARQERLLQWFLVAFLVFLAWGVVSTFVSGWSQWVAGTYQLGSNFKPLLAVILGYALRWDSRMERLFWFVIRWFWLPSLVLVVFEWVVPSLYYKVFASGPANLDFFLGTPSLSNDLSKIFPSRASGPFEHPTIFAGTAATFAILAASRALYFNANSRRSWFLATMYFLLLVFSQERQELAGCVLSIFLLYLLERPDRMMTRLLLVSVLCAISVATFGLFFLESITKELQMAGLGTTTPIDHPRAQLFSGAWALAQKYFPWGSGWGTYGGAGSKLFDLSLYEYLGFRRYWWYGHEDFLMDTYWPNSIGETGFIGAIALFVSYFLLFVYAIKRCLKEATSARLYWATASAMMAYMILLSPTSPAFQDPRLFILPALMFGIATRVSQESHHERV